MVSFVPQKILSGLGQMADGAEEEHLVGFFLRTTCLLGEGPGTSRKISLGPSGMYR